LRFLQLTPPVVFASPNLQLAQQGRQPLFERGSFGVPKDSRTTFLPVALSYGDPQFAGRHEGGLPDLLPESQPAPALSVVPRLAALSGHER